MYNFNFMKDEELVDVFDDILIKQGEVEKVTTVALTNKRLLFLDYLNINDGLEALRIAKGVNYMRYKDVYYQIDLVDIESIVFDEYYQVILKNKMIFEFNNDKLYKLLIKR